MNNLIELLQKYTEVQHKIFEETLKDNADSMKLRKLNIEEFELNTMIHSESKKENAYNNFTEAIEELDDTIFSCMISDLDSNQYNYATLYDLFEPYNSIHKCRVVIPKDALVNITIKHD